MAYIITKEKVHRLLSELGCTQTEELPRYLVLSQGEGTLFRIEPLAAWLSRHGKNRTVPKLSTVHAHLPHSIRDSGEETHGLSV